MCALVADAVFKDAPSSRRDVVEIRYCWSGAEKKPILSLLRTKSLEVENHKIAVGPETAELAPYGKFRPHRKTSPKPPNSPTDRSITRNQPSIRPANSAVRHASPTTNAVIHLRPRANPPPPILHLITRRSAGYLRRSPQQPSRQPEQHGGRCAAGRQQTRRGGLKTSRSIQGPLGGIHAGDGGADGRSQEPESVE